jgi:hypothetical protein
VNGHDPNAVGSLLDDGRLVDAAALGVLLEPAHEGAERRHRALLEATCHVEHAENVAERLFAGRPDRDAGVRARGLEELRDGVGDRASVATCVEGREDIEGVRDGARELGELRLVALAERVQVALRMTEGEERVVGEGEERFLHAGIVATIVDSACGYAARRS